MQIGNAPVGINHGKCGTVCDTGGNRRLNLRPFVRWHIVERAQHRSKTVIWVGSGALKNVAELRERLGKKGSHGVTKNDGVGDLHHRCLHVQ